MFLGRYEIKEKIDQTSNSVIYLAHDAEEDRPVCVKVNRHDSPIAKSAMEAAKILKTLSHDHICKIYDFGMEDGAFYTIMEYIPGTNLEKILKEKGVFSEKEVVEVGKQMLCVLTYLHSLSQPVIYRDMKPANIIKGEDGMYHLVDFDIARQYSAAKKEDTTLLGSRGYAAPEQKKKTQTDPRADQWGVGMTMHALITGKRPYEPPYEMYPAIHFNPSVSPALSKIIEKATSIDPADRFGSVDEFFNRLKSFKEDERAERKKKKVRSGIVTLAVTAALIIAAVIIIKVYTNSLESEGYEVSFGIFDSFIERIKQIGASPTWGE